MQSLKRALYGLFYGGIASYNGPLELKEGENAHVAMEAETVTADPDTGEENVYAEFAY
ncbi:MAG: hypothetical protein PVH29_14040 [Candidatus Zixiibacteriota bacterium]